MLPIGRFLMLPWLLSICEHHRTWNLLWRWLLFLLMCNHRGAFEELEMGMNKIHCIYAWNSHGININIFKTSPASNTLSSGMKPSLAANDFEWDECLNFYLCKSDRWNLLLPFQALPTTCLPHLSQYRFKFPYDWAPKIQVLGWKAINLILVTDPLSEPTQ